MFLTRAGPRLLRGKRENNGGKVGDEDKWSKIRENAINVARTKTDKDEARQEEDEARYTKPCRVDTGASVGNENKVGRSHSESDEQWRKARSRLIRMEVELKFG